MNFILDALHLLIRLAPKLIPSINLGHPPELSTVADLATELGSDPSTIIHMVNTVNEQHRTVMQAVSTAAPLIDQTRRDLEGLAQELVSTATPLMAKVFSADVAASISAQHQLQALPYPKYSST